MSAPAPDVPPRPASDVCEAISARPNRLDDPEASRHRIRELEQAVDVAREKSRCLEMLARGTALPELLAAVCGFVEKHFADSCACILVFDPTGGQVAFTAEAGLPQGLAQLPEIAYVTESPLPVGSSSWLTWMGIRAGYQHESNGRDGDASRSMNRAYFRARFILGSLESWYVVMLPEIHAYVAGLGANPNIKDYRGYGRVQLYLGHRAHSTLRLNLWAGKKLDHLSYQLDLTHPIQLRWLNLESFFQVQYFNGYGESLRAYDKRTRALRFGIALVR